MSSGPAGMEGMGGGYGLKSYPHGLNPAVVVKRLR
jgi:hypothetical protein